MVIRWRPAVAAAVATTLVVAACSPADQGNTSPVTASTTVSTTVSTTRTSEPPTAATTSTAPGSDAVSGPQRLTVEVIAETPHDTDLFTQGLEIDDGRLFESSGLYGTSLVRSVDRATGEVVRSTALEDRIFAEGLTVSEDRLIVLSWQERTAFVFDPDTLEERARYTYEGEGWGLCAFDDRLVMSDGSDTLRFRDPVTFAPVGDVQVRLDGHPLDRINELECVDGQVYANIWKTNDIVRIDPGTGQVTATIDVAALRPESTKADPDAVLNGIAHIAESATFLLTGKRWPMLYEVRFVS